MEAVADGTSVTASDRIDEGIPVHVLAEPDSRVGRLGPAARRVVEDALEGWLPRHYPLVRYGPDRVMLPPHARTLACDESGHAALFQLGKRAFGFAGPPGVKSAIIEDLIMEFPESPAETAAPLAALRENQAAVHQALRTVMTGLVRCLELMGKSET